jgi:2-dehydro-3-deoxygalactonokinase
MTWREGFIAVDWGTTNRRAYAIEPDGQVSNEMEDDLGILSVAPGGFEALVDELRVRLGNRPMLLAGMVGSNRGWREAPYVPAPATLDGLLQGLWWSDDRRCAIVPGVSYVSGDDADVMRGEEVQLFGAAEAGMIPRDGLVCHPGTHAKWAWMRGGAIEGFRTIMTGEMFNLLRQHSILSDALKTDANLGDAFEAGVDHGLHHDDLLAELFSTRARHLLGRDGHGDRASYVSGLLIGQDVRLGLRCAAENSAVAVLGKPELTRLYATAIRRAGRGATESEGEAAFVAGARLIAERLG